MRRTVVRAIPHEREVLSRPFGRLLRAAHDVPGWHYLLALATLLLALGYYELRTSALEAWVLSRLASTVSYRVESGASPEIAFPVGGPFDERRGYSQLPEFVRKLEGAGFRVVEQARQSPGMLRLLGWGVPPPYPEPAATGLVVRDFLGASLFDVRPGHVMFGTFDEIPPLVIGTLLFIENRELASASAGRTNPAIDWRRLAKAGALYAGHKLGLPVRVEGGSTLAVQIEKYRHSTGGRTGSALDKLRQVAGASLRAYREGPDTLRARQQVILDYLNTMPLAAAAGYGEVHGLGEGLRAWFGLDLKEVGSALLAPDPTIETARAFKHVLALLCAVRAPHHYLVENPEALERRLDAYAELLASAGIIERALARILRDVPLGFTPAASHAEAVSFIDHKAVNSIREELRRLLDLPGRYELDRLDLEVESTVDGPLQATATWLLRQLAEREFVEAHGLRGEHLLSSGDPRHVVYSLLLYERTPQGNLLRVRADSLDAPFDVNGGMKLELGSTAKLRTLAHYLELLAGLYAELGGLDPGALGRRAESARDPLTRWAAETFRREPRLDIDAFLAQGLDRTYSASPYEVFLTGGGIQTFENFDRADNARVPTLRQALAHSTNLVFIRLMRDLVRFHQARLPYDAQAVLTRPDDPDRQRMLGEIADEEARQFLARAYRRYRQLNPDAIVRRLLGEKVATRRAQAIMFFAWHPGASGEALAAWLRARREDVGDDEIRALARAYGNPRLTIADFGSLLGRHPLDLWCADQLAREPGLAWEALLARSGESRRIASAWLFQTRHRGAQDLRLRTRIEQDAFARITSAWRRLGFPFERLVPSYATAIGSSSDRPAALAELMGIIVNDGVRRSTVVVRRLGFGAGTPYHTVLEALSSHGERVMAAPVARALRSVVIDTVERGTASRVRGAFVGRDGSSVIVGGKTGSGDNRFETFGRDGQLIASRAVSRTSAFVFYIGDRYFGVITASVAGRPAGDYHFTSALPLSVLRLLAPDINARLAWGSG